MCKPFVSAFRRCRPKNTFCTRPVASFERALAAFLPVNATQEVRLIARVIAGHYIPLSAHIIRSCHSVQQLEVLSRSRRSSWETWSNLVIESATHLPKSDDSLGSIVVHCHYSQLHNTALVSSNHARRHLTSLSRKLY